MTLSYTITREIAANGISRAFAHRHPVRRILVPALGIIFLVAGLRYLVVDESSKWLLGAMLFALGALYIFLPIHRKRKVVENMFAGRSGDIEVEMTPSAGALEIKTPDSSGSASWASFVDYLICEDGILLYPQKSMHFWIPIAANIEDGSWNDFSKIISEKVIRKI